MCVCVCVCGCVKQLRAKVHSTIACIPVLKFAGPEEAHKALPDEALNGVLRILGLTKPAYVQKVWSFSFDHNRISRH